MAARSNLIACVWLILALPAFGQQRGWGSGYTDGSEPGLGGVITWSNVYQLGVAIAERWEHTIYARSQPLKHPYHPKTATNYYQHGWVISTNEQVYGNVSLITGLIHDVLLIAPSFIDIRISTNIPTDLVPYDDDVPVHYTAETITEYATGTNQYRQLLNLGTQIVDGTPPVTNVDAVSPIIFGETISQLYTSINLMAWIPASWYAASLGESNQWLGTGEVCEDLNAAWDDAKAMIDSAAGIDQPSHTPDYMGSWAEALTGQETEPPPGCTGGYANVSLYAESLYYGSNITDWYTNRPVAFTNYLYTMVTPMVRWKHDCYGYNDTNFFGTGWPTSDYIFDDDGYNVAFTNYTLGFSLPWDESGLVTTSTVPMFTSVQDPFEDMSSPGHEEVKGFSYLVGFGVIDLSASNGYAFSDSGVF